MVISCARLAEITDRARLLHLGAPVDDPARRAPQRDLGVGMDQGYELRPVPGRRRREQPARDVEQIGLWGQGRAG